MACNPAITPAKAKQLAEQAEKQIKAGDVINGQHAAKIAQLLDAAIQAEGKAITSVKQIIEHGLKNSVPQHDILDAIKAVYPDSKAGPADVAYYKTKLKKAGLLPHQGGIPGVPAMTPKPPQLTPFGQLQKLDMAAANNAQDVVVVLKAKGIDVDIQQIAEYAMLEKSPGISEKELLDELLVMAGNGDDSIVALKTVLEKYIDANALNVIEQKIQAKLAKKLAEQAKHFAADAATKGFEVDAALVLSDDELQGIINAVDAFLADPTQANILAVKDLGVGITKAAKAHGLSPFAMIENPNTIQDVIIHGLKQGKDTETILKDVKLFYPNSKTTQNSVAYYKTMLKKNGELPGYKGKLASVPGTPGAIAHVPQMPIGTLTRAESLADDVVMGTNLNVPLGGSNNAQLYLGKDGVKRVVKFYPDGQQAYQEHVANQLYRQLGHQAPESGVFKHNGKIGYWSRYEEGVKKFQLTDDLANQVLDGFAADILTANWDVMGLSLDNVGVINGKLVRLDNGSSFLFRAQAGKRKPTHALFVPTEFEKFADGSNPSYAKIFQKLGTSPVQLGERYIKQVDAIEALEKRFGNWDNFVRQLTDGTGMDTGDKSTVAKMLQMRSNQMYAQRQTIRDQLDMLQRRNLGRGDAFKQIADRQRNITDDVIVARYRGRIDDLIKSQNTTYTTPGSIKAKLAKPTSLSSHDSERQAVVNLRRKIMEEEFKNDPNTWKHFHEYESAISNWYGSSSSVGGARLKRALEETFPGEVHTSYHNAFLNHDVNKRKTYYLDQVPAHLIEPFKKFMEVDRKFTKAYVREVMGKDTITLYRGVRADYFQAQGVPKPQKGEEVVVIGNPMDSWSFHEGVARRFSGYNGVVFQAEISVDDMQSIFVAQPYASNFWGEKEVFVIGKPQRAKVK